MARGFIAGFLTATFLWGVAFVAYEANLLDQWLGEGDDIALPDAGIQDADIEPDAGVSKGQRRRRRRRWKSVGRKGHERASITDPDRVVEVGDDLAEGAREIDMEGGGGEARLSPAQIDAAFGPAMPRIRRCLLLLPGDVSGAGRVSFGMRVTGAGRATAVRLRGPRALTTGETGACLQRTARAIQFPQFDGAEMTFNYPVTFN